MFITRNIFNLWRHTKGTVWARFRVSVGAELGQKAHDGHSMARFSIALAQCGHSWAQTSKISEKNSVSIKYGFLGEISTNQNQENKAISLLIG